jgi:hypothetical protein
VNVIVAQEQDDEKEERCEKKKFGEYFTLREN